MRAVFIVTSQCMYAERSSLSMPNEVAKLNVHTIIKHPYQQTCVLTCIFSSLCSLQVALHEHTTLLFLQCVSVAPRLGSQRSLL